MKRIIVLIVLTICCGIQMDATEQMKQDTIRDNVRYTIDYIYSNIIPMLDRVEIAGSSEASQELRKRWGWVVDYLKNNKEFMFHEVKKKMLTPSGKTIDIETVKKFIDLAEQDSVKKIKLNPDFLLDELKVLGEKLKDAGIKMAEQK